MDSPTRYGGHLLIPVDLLGQRVGLLPFSIGFMFGLTAGQSETGMITLWRYSWTIIATGDRELSCI